MGTTAEKGAYIIETKSLLKQKINNLGGDITSQTTFRQYADKLQTIYDNVPKTSYAEGSNITLSNCLKGKLDYEDDKVGYGDTEQESTTGKNKFGFGVSATDVTATYRPTANQRLDVTEIGLNELKFNFRNGNYSRAYFEIDGIDGTQNWAISFVIKENTTNYTPTYTIDTANSTNTKLIFYISGGNGATAVSSTDYFILSDIQVEEGSSVTSFEKFTGRYSCT